MAKNDLHVIELFPEYLLEMLGEVEARQVQEHLGECGFCRKEMQAYQTVMGQLPLAVQQFDPPSRVKTQLFRQIEKNNLRPVPERKWLLGRGSRAGLPLWNLISIVVILALIVVNLFLWQQVRNITKMNSQQFRVVELARTEAAPEAFAWLVISPDGEYGTLIVNGLPIQEEGKAYQLWLIRGDERSSGGVFTVGANGYGSMRVDAPEPLSSYGRVGITVEPAGGSPGPTGERVFAGDL